MRRGAALARRGGACDSPPPMKRGARYASGVVHADSPPPMRRGAALARRGGANLNRAIAHMASGLVLLVGTFFATQTYAAGFTFAALGDAPYYDHEEQP